MVAVVQSINAFEGESKVGVGMQNTIFDQYESQRPHFILPLLFEAGLVFVMFGLFFKKIPRSTGKQCWKMYIAIFYTWLCLPCIWISIILHKLEVWSCLGSSAHLPGQSWVSSFSGRMLSQRGKGWLLFCLSQKASSVFSTKVGTSERCFILGLKQRFHLIFLLLWNLNKTSECSISVKLFCRRASWRSVWFKTIIWC